MKSLNFRSINFNILILSNSHKDRNFFYSFFIWNIFYQTFKTWNNFYIYICFFKNFTNCRFFLSFIIFNMPFWKSPVPIVHFHKQNFPCIFIKNNRPARIFIFKITLQIVMFHNIFYQLFLLILNFIPKNEFIQPVFHFPDLTIAKFKIYQINPRYIQIIKLRNFSLFFYIFNFISKIL